MILGKDNIERLPLPVGTSDWATFSRRAYCVDKTLMIKDLIDSETSVALFTRPRRFGKTTAMRMIRAFYEGDASLFEDKQIWAAGSTTRPSARRASPTSRRSASPTSRTRSRFVVDPLVLAAENLILFSQTSKSIKKRQGVNLGLALPLIRKEKTWR